jgi:hypothetical protein
LRRGVCLASDPDQEFFEGWHRNQIVEQDVTRGLDVFPDKPAKARIQTKHHCQIHLFLLRFSHQFWHPHPPQDATGQPPAHEAPFPR